MSILDEIAAARPLSDPIPLQPTLDRVKAEIPDEEDRAALHLLVDFNCVQFSHEGARLLIWYLPARDLFETALYRASGFVTTATVQRGALRDYVIDAFRKG